MSKSAAAIQRRAYRTGWIKQMKKMCDQNGFTFFNEVLDYMTSLPDTVINSTTFKSNYYLFSNFKAFDTRENIKTFEDFRDNMEKLIDHGKLRDITTMHRRKRGLRNILRNI